MAKKLCEICGASPATVPDRNRPGRLINRVCGRCHGLRLAGDMREIMRLHEQRRHRPAAQGERIMGITTTTSVAYTCDMCRKPTDKPFEPETRVLWSDRDVSARTRVSAVIEIDYCPGAVVLCQPCAASLMRAEADRIDPTTTAQQRKGE